MQSFSLLQREEMEKISLMNHFSQEQESIRFYHHGDINAFHVSYFRRKEPDERSFHTCNLRKSYGFYLVAQGADPIPDVADVSAPYKLGLLKYENQVRFFVNDLEVFNFNDDGTTYGPCLEGGKIGFRQLAPMIGEYSKLKVYSFEN